MDALLLLLLGACVAAARAVLGFGMDPDLQIDVIQELGLVNSSAGVTRVSGLHNASKAFLFQDVERELHAAPHVSEKLVQLFRNTSEFTFLATIRQRASMSGVILSIRELEHSYFELESSGLRDEIRYHYRSKGKSRTEVFPYRMADGQWHKIALSVSASHLLLHVDCNRIYERVIDPPETNLTPGSSLWLGQRNRKHALFKGIMQDVKIIFVPSGYITQCPNLNRTKCIYGGRVLAEGQRILTKSCRECRNGVLVKVTEACLPLNCTENDRILPENQCCSVCRGHNFCAEGHRCGENSECKNWNTKATCECKNGYIPVQGDAAYCEDIDECAAEMHYCHANTICVNLPGAYRCDCMPGYIRVDDFSCTEHDECGSGQPNCDENAICINTVRGHSCTCKPGYVGNGTICQAFCEEGCKYGGSCVTPNKCACPPGFTGSHCEKDVDECAEGIIECHSHSRCVNLPGWYHCECRSGFHDNGTYSLSGESCVDVDECALKTHTCWNDSACVNLKGGFDCLCPSGPSCTGDCWHEEGLKRNGQVWTLKDDRCSVCSCKDGKIFCRRTACDCQNPNADLFCCPECDTRATSRCLDQNGHTLYRSGDNWTHSCQQCRCLEGEVDCWPLTCPNLSCEYTAISEGECCPRCVSDPCLADNIAYNIRKTCLDPYGLTRLSGSVWTMTGSPCTTCKCKNGNVCCSVDLECLHNN
ncbi:protein kinase C-binding protein NELL1 isoform X6 [Rhinatrema bivittatum]|uniref:protein kinase C-binding protein NELL1 isoform X6 n=1 Tax=Rhinatrema bivittatum TaxID=194408 RepID=UPI00112EAB77|nr:protein kinase C-binding protein NELL1 isoform X6 [Rhinatrema bivittatum]